MVLVKRGPIRDHSNRGKVHRTLDYSDENDEYVNHHFMKLGHGYWRGRHILHETFERAKSSSIQMEIHEAENPALAHDSGALTLTLSDYQCRTSCTFPNPLTTVLINFWQVWAQCCQNFRLDDLTIENDETELRYRSQARDPVGFRKAVALVRIIYDRIPGMEPDPREENTNHPSYISRSFQFGQIT